MPPEEGNGKATAALVADALRPVAASKGKSFVRYPTPASGRVHDATLDKSKLLANKEVVDALMQTNLDRLTESVMETAMEMLFDEFKEVWQLTDDEQHSWVKTISLRCRVMVSLVNLAMKKNGGKVPKWVQELGLGNAAAAAGPPTSLGAARGGPESLSPFKRLDDYKFGFIESKGVAFRVPIDKPNAKQELSLPLQMPTSEEGFPIEDNVSAVATFADGMTVSVPGCTVKKLREMQAARGGKIQTPLWEGTHHATHHVLQLKQRPDRCLLLSLYEQSRQVCQWKVAKHGVLEDPTNSIKPADHEAVVAAANFAIPFCLKYAEGHFEDAKELKKAVDAAYQKEEAASKATPKKSKKRKAIEAEKKSKSAVQPVQEQPVIEDLPIKQEIVQSEAAEGQEEEATAFTMPPVPNIMADSWFA